MPAGVVNENILEWKRLAKKKEVPNDEVTRKIDVDLTKGVFLHLFTPRWQGWYILQEGEANVKKNVNELDIILCESKS